MRPIPGTITDRGVTRSLRGGGHLPDVLVTNEDPWHFTVMPVTTRARQHLDCSEAVTYDTYDFKRLFDGLVDAGLVVR
jgi:hypothetical protein